MTSSGLREELDCSICLNLYTHPVSLKCGHNFCRECIAAVLDTQEKSRRYSCPECREQYRERPLLNKNRKLCNIVDNFRTTYQEETEVFCTYCDSPVPAFKSCLHCEASFCNKHLKGHSKSVHHILTKPTTSFENRKCSAHQEVLKYYCTEDGACICMSCWVAGDHKGHKVELLNEASKKTKEKLRESTNKLNSEKQEAERRIQNLEKHTTEDKIAVVTGRVNELFRDIRKRLDDAEKKVLIELSRQQEQISRSVSGLIQQLEQQKDALTRTILQIEELCNIQDPLTVLKNAPNKEDTSPEKRDTINDVGNAVCLDERVISEMLHRGLLHFTDSFVDLKIKRLFVVTDKSGILLDINTADNNITISDDLKVASYSTICQKRPEGPERFKSKQVLSTNSFTSGRYYWEVDVSAADKWLIGVAAHSIERKMAGNKSYIGYNDKSWGLALNPSLSALHNNLYTKIGSDSPVKSVGIYLDYEAGRLSFYKLCEPIKRLHTFTTTFTEPLHAAFYMYEKCTIRIIA